MLPDLQLLIQFIQHIPLIFRVIYNFSCVSTLLNTPKTPFRPGISALEYCLYTRNFCLPGIILYLLNLVLS